MKDECRGIDDGNKDNRELVGFNKFIERVVLFEIQCSGRKYTCIDQMVSDPIGHR